MGPIAVAVAALAALAGCETQDDGARDGAADVEVADSEVDTDGPEAVADTDASDADLGDSDMTPEEVADTNADGGDVAVDADAEVRPPELMLTVAQVPASMNGSRPTMTPTGPLPYRLRVNRAGFELDVWAGGTVVWETLDLTCRGADGEPFALPALEVRGPLWRQARFDDAVVAPPGAIRCEASITGPLGAAEAAYEFDAADLDRRRDPFPDTDVWVVMTRRDVFATTAVSLPDGTVDLRSTFQAGGDGVDDFDAPFFELGLMSRSSPEAAATVRSHLLRRVKGHVQGIYGLGPDGAPTPGGVDLRLYFEGDAGAPDPNGFNGEAFSRIALTGDGDPEDQLAGTFGRALIDWNNQDTEDDAAYGLGVWPAALARGILRNPLGVLLLEPYRPAQGGVAFGDHPDDAQFLGRDGVDVGTLTGDAPQRYAIYELVMDLGSMALASILAHEMGHSLGLVPFGAPPDGLFAGVRADFTVTLAPDAHIDIEGLNVMQTGGNLNLSEAVGGERPAFEPLSWAYLRRQLVVGPAR